MRPFLAPLALGLLLAGCPKSTPGADRATPPLELTLPRYPDLRPVSLADERGHVVLLDIWATWCEPCRESLPRYQALVPKYEAKGLRMYAVNVDAASALAAEVPKFLAETKLSVPVLLDTDAKAAEGTLRVKVMPTLLFIDRQGRLRHVHEGFEGDESVAEVVTRLEQLLAEP